MVGEVTGLLSYKIKLKDGSLYIDRLTVLGEKLLMIVLLNLFLIQCLMLILMPSYLKMFNHLNCYVSSAPSPIRLNTDGSAELSLGLKRSTRILHHPKKYYGQESGNT